MIRMDRRKFIRNVTAAGTASGLALQAGTPQETHSVKYAVEGFSCITCAVGLEAMLKTRKGVARVAASYPEKSVVIGFDNKMTSEKALTDFIAGCGFSVT